jgi:pimeloyl-ACP methyl ester carboxylesterase
MTAATMHRLRGNGNLDPSIKVDYLEAGSSGPVVMLVHSSVSGARQWRRLMGDLKDQFRVRAVNLFGYGKTPAWPAETIQSLDDQARPVEAALPANADEVYLVRALVRRFSCHEGCGATGGSRRQAGPD